jgi:hypothetical protein
MQTLFHSVAWIGVPGLYLGAKKLFSGAFSVGEVEGERDAPRIPRLSEELIKGLTEGFARSVARGHQPREVHHYHHRQEQKRDTNIPAEEDSPENSDDDEETKLRKRRNKRRQKTKVAPYEPTSTGLWITMFTGAACSFYFTYEWAYNKCKSICKSVQGRVENIQ